MSLVHLVADRLRRAWIVTVAVVVVGGWAGAHLIVSKAMPNVSESTSLFVEMLVVAALYGVVTWLFVVHPRQRRNTSMAVVDTPRRPRGPRPPATPIRRSMTVAPRRHLALVPSLSDHA